MRYFDASNLRLVFGSMSFGDSAGRSMTGTLEQVWQGNPCPGGFWAAESLVHVGWPQLLLYPLLPKSCWFAF